MERNKPYLIQLANLFYEQIQCIRSIEQQKSSYTEGFSIDKMFNYVKRNPSILNINYNTLNQFMEDPNFTFNDYKILLFFIYGDLEENQNKNIDIKGFKRLFLREFHLEKVQNNNWAEQSQLLRNQDNKNYQRQILGFQPILSGVNGNISSIAYGDNNKILESNLISMQPSMIIQNDQIQERKSDQIVQDDHSVISQGYNNQQNPSKYTTIKNSNNNKPKTQPKFISNPKEIPNFVVGDNNVFVQESSGSLPIVPEYIPALNKNLQQVMHNVVNSKKIDNFKMLGCPKAVYPNQTQNYQLSQQQSVQYKQNQQQDNRIIKQQQQQQPQLQKQPSFQQQMQQKHDTDMQESQIVNVQQYNNYINSQLQHQQSQGQLFQTFGQKPVIVNNNNNNIRVQQSVPLLHNYNNNPQVPYIQGNNIKIQQGNNQINNLSPIKQQYQRSESSYTNNINIQTPFTTK